MVFFNLKVWLKDFMMFEQQVFSIDKVVTFCQPLTNEGYKPIGTKATVLANGLEVFNKYKGYEGEGAEDLTRNALTKMMEEYYDMWALEAV